MSFLAAQLEGFVIPAYEFITAPHDTGLPEAFGKRQLEQLHKIARIIDQGKEQGSIRKDVDFLACRLAFDRIRVGGGHSGDDGRSRVHRGWHLCGDS